MLNRRIPSLFPSLAVLLVASLAACGGGGDSPSASQAFAVVLEVDGTGDAQALQIRVRVPGLSEQVLTNPALPYSLALSAVDGETVEASVSGQAVNGTLSLALRDDPNVVSVPEVYASDACGPAEPNCSLAIQHRF